MHAATTVPYDVQRAIERHRAGQPPEHQPLTEAAQEGNERAEERREAAQSAAMLRNSNPEEATVVVCTAKAQTPSSWRIEGGPARGASGLLAVVAGVAQAYDTIRMRLHRAATMKEVAHVAGTCRSWVSLRSHSARVA